MKAKYFYLLIILFLPFAELQAITFNPESILSDEEISQADSMTLADIELFLKSKNGYISRNYFTDCDGKLKSAATIIYEAAHNYDCDNIELNDKTNRSERATKCRPAPINPKLLLVLLQKEQSLIEELNPTQKQLDWATGYAVCDNCSMNDPAIQRWKGFGKQINSASLQFFDYLKNPHHYSYRAGRTYTINNTGRPPLRVSVANQATAALYNYTPHVYNGNYNFFKLWSRYFTRSYPNNSLLQARGEVGVFLIQNDKKRPFLSRGALTSRYDINKIIQVNKSDLDKYPLGKPIKFSQYSLLRSPRGTIFLLVDDKRRGFASAEAFRKIGFNPEEIINATWDDINAYEESLAITATSSYPTGALLQDMSTGGIYYVSEGTKAPLWDRVLLQTKFKRRSITQESPEKLASYRTIEPAIFNDGELLTTDTSPAVYAIDNKKRRPIISGDAFLELGYKWENIISIPNKILELYEIGEPLGQKFNENEEIIIEDSISSSSKDYLASSTNSLSSSTNDLQEEINNILNP